MRILGDLILVLVVAVIIVFAVHIVYAVVKTVTLGGGQIAESVLNISSSADISWLVSIDLNPLLQGIEMGLIIAFAAMIIAAFMYSRRR